jgi:replicative DNA helicase
MANQPIFADPPYSQEAEEAVIGAVLINPNAFLTVASFLQPEDFYLLRHSYIWQALLRLHDRRDPIDYLTLGQELQDMGLFNEIGGSAFITQLITNTPTSVHAEVYGRLVERASIRRRLMKASDDIKALALDEQLNIEAVTSEAEIKLFDVTDRQLKREFVAINDAVHEYFDRIEHLMQNQSESMGLPTGFRDLDALLGGFQRSDLLLFAGRPGMGKTSFMLSTAVNAARIGGRVAIFSLEMGVEQLVQRMISMETGLGTQQLRLGKLNAQEYSRFVEAAGRISRFPIFIDDTPALNPIQMRTKCRRLQHEYGIDLVIVDYMQLMNAGGQYQNNRVQEISYISRSLKELARELNVPLFSAAQLSRAVEQRQDKRPVLSDLRESGCLAGDTLIYLPDEGHYVEIRELVGRKGFQVASLDPQTHRLKCGVVTNAFHTGYKPVYRLTTRLGRSIRATGNHKFLTICGWKRLDELSLDDFIALPRTLPGPQNEAMTDAEVALLGHLIGDGCTLPKHVIQYTTHERDLAETVTELAHEVFGNTVIPRIHKDENRKSGASWYQVFLPSTRKLTHGLQTPVRTWLEGLGIFGLRSHEKYVPQKIYEQHPTLIGLFLRHLWATDGCIHINNGQYPRVYYATSSQRLAIDVQSLLLRLGINARLKSVSQNGKGCDQYHVILSGQEDLTRFIERVGAVSTLKRKQLVAISDYLQSHAPNTNRDIIPAAIWRMHVVPAMQEQQVTAREMQARLGNAYCGTSLYKQNISRDRARRLSEILQSIKIGNLADSDVYWDRIDSIQPDGETDVYDLTVEGYHNFVANNIIVHNSIEQDADIVMFLYRDAIYNEATEFPNQADILIAKHRNGPTGVVSLYFDKTITKFIDGAVRSVDLGEM